MTALAIGADVPITAAVSTRPSREKPVGVQTAAVATSERDGLAAGSVTELSQATRAAVSRSKRFIVRSSWWG
jgi:hypothetical protein